MSETVSVRDMDQGTLRAHMCKNFTQHGTEACLKCHDPDCPYGAEWIRRIDRYGEPITDAQARARAERGELKAQPSKAPKPLPPPVRTDRVRNLSDRINGFHLWLQEYQKQNKITMTEISKRSNVNPATVHDIIKARTDGYKSSQDKIMAALGADPEDVRERCHQIARERGIRLTEDINPRPREEKKLPPEQRNPRGRPNVREEPHQAAAPIPSPENLIRQASPDTFPQGGRACGAGDEKPGSATQGKILPAREYFLADQTDQDLIERLQNENHWLRGQIIAYQDILWHFIHGKD